MLTQCSTGEDRRNGELTGHRSKWKSSRERERMEVGRGGGGGGGGLGWLGGGRGVLG